MAAKAEIPVPAFAAGFIRRSDFGSKSDFIFGSATAAFQVEGACGKGYGRERSIWDTHAEDKKLYAPYTEDAVCHYKHYKEDVRLMKEIGFDAYRFSVSWSRILNYPRNESEDSNSQKNKKINEKGVQFYQKLLDKLEENDIQPFVTLLHFDHPQSLEDLGGFLNEDTTEHFKEFAGICFDKFGDRVKHWITINEPWSFVYGGYVLNYLAPAKGKVKDKFWKEESDLDLLLESLNMNPDYEHTYETGRFGIKRTQLADALERALQPKKDGEDKGAGTRPPSTVDESASSDQNYRKSGIGIAASDGQTKETEASSTSVKSTASTQVANELCKGAYTVAHNLLLAHAKAVELYKNEYKHQDGQIGITLVGAWYIPLTDSKEDKEAQQRTLDFMLGWFLDPLVNGKYPETMEKYVTQGHLPVDRMAADKYLIQGSYDFIGLNYYTTYYVSHRERSKGNYIADHCVEFHKRDPNNVYISADKGASGWIYGYPNGIREILAYMKSRYEKPDKSLPIYITENGIDDHDDLSGTCWKAFWDKKRVSYLHDHLSCVLAAKQHDKVDVKGYFVWSLLDNFEWNQGFRVRFGIIYVDYDDGGQRYPKLSAKWLKHFLAN